MTVDTEWLVSLVEDGRVRTEIYTGPRVFDAEMERIFARTWVYVAHESEIAEPGDYKTVTLGTQPVMVVRDKERRIQVLLNRCRHRGASVCQREAGQPALGLSLPHAVRVRDAALRRGRTAADPARVGPPRRLLPLRGVVVAVAVAAIREPERPA